MAETVQASPATYRRALLALHPGDTLRLGPGVYRNGLPLHGQRGTAQRPIVIAGTPGGGTVLWARAGHNTVSLRGASHLVIRDLQIDGRGLPVDAVKAEGGRDCRPSSHIVLERLRLFGFGGDQQVVGISTKCAAWHWTIRDNNIEGAGAGIYLGNSDGSAPFVRGVIEGNTITASIGYGMQIKHQNDWKGIPALASVRGSTRIAGNVISKGTGSSSGPLARPDLLVGHSPREGRGSDDIYHIFANLLLHNPTEALFQGEGNVAFYNNALLNCYASGFPAIAIQPHNDIPRRVRIFNNTVVTRDTCIAVRSAVGIADQLVTGNALFCDTPLRGSEASMNVSAPFALAPDYLRYPFAVSDALDLRPRPGRLLGPRLEPGHAGERFPGDATDFYGALRSGAHRGAFAGDSAPVSARPRAVGPDACAGFRGAGSH